MRTHAYPFTLAGYRAAFGDLFRLTRCDVLTGAVLLPGSRAYRQCSDIRREAREHAS